MLGHRIARPALLAVALCDATAHVGSGTAATSLSPFPKQLAGVWSRTVTAADIQRAHAKHAVKPGVWKIDVQAAKARFAGNVYITQTGRPAGLGGSLYAVAPGHVSISVGFPSLTAPGPLNDWKWKVAGKLLTFTPVKDPNSDRVAFFAGVWKKVA
jgi:hypothetical protein